MGAGFLGEEERHDLAAHGAAGEKEGEVGGEGAGGWMAARVVARRVSSGSMRSSL